MLKMLALGLVLGISTTSTLSQTPSDIQIPSDGNAYLQNSQGVISRSQHGLCWRTGHWTPADAVAGCDGELIPPIAKPTAPPIAPSLSVAQAPAVPTQCDFSTTINNDNDQTFDFNKVKLSATAKRRIVDEVITKLSRCGKINMILITGHTDPLGTQQYNQKLSEKRAKAVTTYLQANGVTAKMNTLGASDTQPIKACDGKLPRPQLIACLTPNRRVTIEVRGLAK